MTSPASPIEEQDNKHFARRWLALGVLSLALFMASLDNTILNVALPTLAKELKASTGQLQWTVDSYQVTFAGLLLVAGAFVDRWGRTKTFLTGAGVFGLFSLLAGLAPNVELLIVFRALMGIGAALLTPSTLALVSAIFHEPKERTLAFAIWSGANATGGAAGPLLSGILLEHFSWGSIFFINVPVALIIVIAGPFVLQHFKPDSSLKGIDIVGALLSTIALALVCWTVISAPGFGLLSAPIIISAVLGLALMIGFVSWEANFSEPILDLSLFKNRRFSVAVSVAGLVTGGGSAALFILTQYLQFNLAYDPLESGIRILPVAVALGIGVFSAPKLISSLKLKNTVLIGLVFVASGFFWMSFVTVESTYSHMLIGALAFGIGAGLLNPAATQAVMDALPQWASGVGSATNSSLMQVGSAMGVAFGGALLSTRYQNTVANSSIFEQLGEWKQAVLDSYAGAVNAADHFTGPLGEKIIYLAKAGFVEGMSWALIGCGAAVTVSAIAVAVLYPSDKKSKEISDDAE